MNHDQHRNARIQQYYRKWLNTNEVQYYLAYKRLRNERNAERLRTQTNRRVLNEARRIPRIPV